MVLKRKLIEELLKSSQWASKLEKARSFKDAEKVIVDFARSRGFKVMEVPKLWRFQFDRIRKTARQRVPFPCTYGGQTKVKHIKSLILGLIVVLFTLSIANVSSDIGPPPIYFPDVSVEGSKIISEGGFLWFKITNNDKNAVVNITLKAISSSFHGFKININEDITLNTPSDFYAFNKYLDVSYTVKKNESLNYYFIAPYLKENESFRDYYFVWRIKAINISPSATSFSIFSVRVISLEWKTLIQDDDFWQTLNQLRDDVLDWQTKYYDLWLKYSSRSEQVSDLQKEFYELAREHYKLTRQYRLVLTIVTSVAVFFFITSLILLTIVFRRLKK